MIDNWSPLAVVSERHEIVNEYEMLATQYEGVNARRGWHVRFWKTGRDVVVKNRWVSDGEIYVVAIVGSAFPPDRMLFQIGEADAGMEPAEKETILDSVTKWETDERLKKAST